MTTLKTIKWFGLVVLLLSGVLFSQKTVAQPGVTVPVESFYNELAPYGQWMQYPGYGNVWLPNAGPDFQPYASGGHWVVTEYGNTWVSDYAWGWAPFHYGRWIFDQAYGGWLWIPGQDWGPAWVSWRSGGGYYGWAPLSPGWDINVNFNIQAPYWTFVPQIYITSPRLYSYCVPRPQIGNVYYNTTIINNYYRTNNRAYAYGPPRGDIERVTRRSVPVYRIDQMDRPGRSVVGNGSVGFYRPGPSYSRGGDYGRNDRVNNAPQPAYNGNSASSRGNYGDNNTPSRTYDRSPVAPNQGYSRDGASRQYSQPFAGESNGNSANRTMPDPGNAATAQPNRFEPSRGQFSPGSVPQTTNSGQAQSGGWNSRGLQQGQGGGFQQNRTFERSESQPQMNSQPSQPMSGGRSEAFQQRTQESRGQAQGQGVQQRSMEQGQRSHEGFNPGGRRGPR